MPLLEPYRRYTRPASARNLVGHADDQVGVTVAVEIAGGHRVAEMLVLLAVADDADGLRVPGRVAGGGQVAA